MEALTSELLLFDLNTATHRTEVVSQYARSYAVHHRMLHMDEYPNREIGNAHNTVCSWQILNLVHLIVLSVRVVGLHKAQTVAMPSLLMDVCDCRLVSHCVTHTCSCEALFISQTKSTHHLASQREHQVTGAL